MALKKTAGKSAAKKTAQPEVHEGKLDDIEQIMADMGDQIDVLAEGKVETLNKASAWRLIRRGQAQLVKK